MKLICKKTNELSPKDISNYCDCFHRVFHKKKDSTVFQSEFSNTCLGYSFHSLLLDEYGEVKGGYTSIPILYEVGGNEMLFAFGVDLMIDESVRDDASNLLSVIRANNNVLKDAGVKCFYGFPNDNSYKVNLAFIRMKDVGSLNTYILPWRVGSVKSSLSILNACSSLFAHVLMITSKIGSCKKVIEYRIHKKRPEFENARYQWFKKDEYQHYYNEEMSCYWKITNYDGVEAAFLMDVYPMSEKNFNKAVRIAYKNCNKQVGLLLYVGRLPFSPKSMIKVPNRFSPKNFHFVAKIMDRSVLDNDIIFNVSNWDVNLASYDLI